ncbi:MAG: hypothetical protein IKG25_02360 [Mogibacterium sp.]|nr:hypothetical protein [Mogibacterium sp.]MBR3330041.1 hypothetical protein [Mogibacterium sp.]
MITTKIETITPEIAQQYLTHNVRNYRKYQPLKAKAYAMDIKNGKWEFNGESISFYENGDLADGQHRLNAVIIAGTPIVSSVNYGVSNDVVIFDVGKGRSLHELGVASGLEGYANSTKVMAVATMYVSGVGRNSTPKRTIVEYVRDHAAELAEARRIVRVGSTRAICDNSAICALTYALVRGGAKVNLMEDFFSVVNSGFAIDGRDCTPAIVFRNMMLEKFGSDGISRDSAKRMFGNAYLAINDFAAQNKRRNKYNADVDIFDSAVEYVRQLDAKGVNIDKKEDKE